MQSIKVPVIVGAALTALAGVLTALSIIPAATIYAAAGVSIVNSIAASLAYEGEPSKVRVPAIVGVILTAVSGALAAVSAVPAVTIYATAAVSAINALLPLFDFGP